MIEHGSGERYVRMELKYCECCGGLLLRREGEPVVYCGPCDRKLHAMAVREQTEAKAVSAIAKRRREEETAEDAMACADVPRFLPQSVAANAATCGARRQA